MTATQFSLGSPLQLDDGSSFVHNWSAFEEPHALSPPFADCSSSPGAHSTHSSSAPSSAFLGYTPPTSDDDSDKDAEGEIDACTKGKTYNDSSLESALAGALAEFSATFPSSIQHEAPVHSSPEVVQKHIEYPGEDQYSPADLSHYRVNDITTVGNYSSLSSSTPHEGTVFYQNDNVQDSERRSSSATSLSFGSSSVTSYSACDNAHQTIHSYTPASDSLQIPGACQPISPTYVSTPLDSYTSIWQEANGGFTSSADQPAVKIEELYSCSFADCTWISDQVGNLKIHQEEHVRAGIFNCPDDQCFKHFSTYHNLAAHRVLEHAASEHPAGPQTSFISSNSEADQYFMATHTYAQSHASVNPHTVYNAGYDTQPHHVLQGRSDPIGLGLIGCNYHSSEQAAFQPAFAIPQQQNVFDTSRYQSECMSRRASESDIPARLSSKQYNFAYASTLPSLAEHEASHAIYENTVHHHQQFGSVCSSASGTPQHAYTTTIPLQSPASANQIQSSSHDTEHYHHGATSYPTTYATMANNSFPLLSGTDPRDAGARPCAANSAYREGVFGHHPSVTPSCYSLGVPVAVMPTCSDHLNHQPGYGHAAVGAYFQQSVPLQLDTQHISMAAIEPQAAFANEYHHSFSHSPEQAPQPLSMSLVNHLVQRLAAPSLPRRGSEASYLTSHTPLNAGSTALHPYAACLSAALTRGDMKLELPDLADSVGPARTKPKRRTNLPGPKGQRITKTSPKPAGMVGFTIDEMERIDAAEQKLHICGYEGCLRVFKRLEHKRRHQRSHTLEKPYQCTIEGCGRFFSRSDNLTQHKRTHERDGRTTRLTQANLQLANAYMTSPEA